MASRREQILQQLLVVFTAARPNSDVKRNQDKPETIPPGGMVVIRDGDPGKPDVDLSPLAYIFDHRIPIEVGAFESGSMTREEVLDEILGDLGAAIAADRTLGGLCDFVQVEAATTDDIEVYGALSGRWADTAVIATYRTTDPLN